MINLIDILRIVYKNMFEKKGRVFLTVSGIVIGIFTFTFFIFVSQGLSNAITEQFSSFGLNVLGVQAVSAQNNGPPSGSDLTDTDVARIKQVVTDYKYVAPSIFYTAQYEYGRETALIVGLAYPDENLEDVKEDLGIKIADGRNIRPGDRGVALIGAKVAEETYDKEITVGTSLKMDGKSLRVIGIMEEKGDLFMDNSLITSFDDIKEISGQEGYTIIRVSFFEGADLEANQRAIERKLNPNEDEKRVQVTSPQQQMEQFDQIIGVLSLIISFISSVALIVGGINVMNTMYSNVHERINEISVMKALGGTNSDIRNFFLVESSILGFMGAMIGFTLAYGLAELLSFVITNYLGYNVPVNFDTILFIEIILVTTFFAMLFGTYPALKAAKVNPADNLRDE